jgi:uncharacterized membrane protein YgcG
VEEARKQRFVSVLSCAVQNLGIKPMIGVPVVFAWQVFPPPCSLGENVCYNNHIVMKYTFIFRRHRILTIVLGVGALCSIFSSSVAQAQETIRSYAVDAAIQSDATVRITETIAYDFGAADFGVPARHGITRDIPLSVPGASNLSIAISNVSATINSGLPVLVRESIVNGVENIRIGDPSKTVSGLQTYQITYVVAGAIGYFADHDEFYWNVLGNGWGVGVDHASATVVLPLSPASTTPTATCYTGAVGSRQQSCLASVAGGNKIVFATTRALAPHEAFTIVVGFPKNSVAYAPVIGTTSFAGSTFSQAPLASWGWVYGLVLVLGAVGWLIYARQRRSSRPGSPVPQYNPPQNITPLETAALMTDPFSKGLVAQIISCAARGYFTITYLSQKTLGIFPSYDFQLSRTAVIAESAVDSIDAALLAMLFPENALSVTLSDLAGSMRRRAMTRSCLDIVQGSYEKLVAGGYLKRTPRQVIRRSVLYGLVPVFIVIVVSAFIFGTFGVLGVFATAVILLMGTPWNMISATPQGRELYWYLTGLKYYISVAEEGRIEFHDAPEKNAKKFQELLPYAIALGTEKQWAEKFDGLFTSDDMPWYAGQNAHTAPSIFVSSIAQTFTPSFAHAAGIRGSGSSGFSGGAGAGGGSGGGGGGSW